MNVLLTGAMDYSHEFFEELQRLGYDVLFWEKEGEAMPSEYFLCDVVVQMNLFAANPIEQFTRLKYVQGLSAGYEAMPIEKFKAQNITFCNARGVYSNQIAEFTIMRLLEMCKRANVLMSQQERHIWKRDYNVFELTKKRIAILGTGSIGSEIARRLSAFGATLVGFNSDGRSIQYFDETYCLDDIYENPHEYFAIIAALPLNDKTYHFANERLFHKMDGRTMFINVGRGGSVDQGAIVHALHSGKLMCAALDVFESEPLKADDPIWDAPNILISPHVVSGSDYMNARAFDLVMENLSAYIKGEGLKNIIG